MWVRGLKPDVDMAVDLRLGVAPRVGAWIETLMVDQSLILMGVAPRVGAWIETRQLCATVLLSYRSHPVWVRGLKLPS